MSAYPGCRMAIARRSITTLLTVLTAVLITVASTLTMAVALAATALIVPGTGTPNANIVGSYLENARDYYISPFNPACTADNDCALQGIDYPRSSGRSRYRAGAGCRAPSGMCPPARDCPC